MLLCVRSMIIKPITGQAMLRLMNGLTKPRALHTTCASFSCTWKSSVYMPATVTRVQRHAHTLWQMPMPSRQGAHRGADTQWMHATAQDSGAPSASDDDEEEEEEEEDAIEDDDEVLDIQGEVAEFPEPSQDADQWTDDEALLAHGPSINTGKVAWGEIALTITTDILSSSSGELSLYALTADPTRKRLSIRIDKLGNMYGSPSLEDIESFCKAFNPRFEEAVGEGVAGGIEVEVSSPGAERQLKLPGDLTRFAELPMKVEFLRDDDKLDTRVLSLEEYNEAEGHTVWRLANVRFNRKEGKGSQLTRKQKDMRFELPPTRVRRANLFIDL